MTSTAAAYRPSARAVLRWWARTFTYPRLVGAIFLGSASDRIGYTFTTTVWPGPRARPRRVYSTSQRFAAALEAADVALWRAAR